MLSSQKDLKMPKRNYYILGIEGVHAIGKSTILNFLAKKHTVYEERLCEVIPEHPYAAQLFFLSGYIQRDQKIRSRIRKTAASKKIIITDRTPFSALAYGYATLSREEYDALLTVYGSYRFLKEDLIFLLHADPGIVIKRLKERKGNHRDLFGGRLLDEDFINLVSFSLEQMIQKSGTPYISLNVNGSTSLEISEKIEALIQNIISEPNRI